MSFPALDNLIASLSSLPGIGPRSAHRIAFHLLKMDDRQVRQLGDAILELKRSIHFCHECGGLTDSDLCEICSNPKRDRTLLCVVEEPGDIFAIEKTGEFKGLYHVLMGALSPLDGIGPEDLRVDEFLERIHSNGFEEIFIATNPTLEGDATAAYLSDRIQDQRIRITRISHGIPTGASIEYADRSTLAVSIRNRQALK
jgi:recombination protein RecR